MEPRKTEIGNEPTAIGIRMEPTEIELRAMAQAFRFGHFAYNVGDVSIEASLVLKRLIEERGSGYFLNAAGYTELRRHGYGARIKRRA